MLKLCGVSARYKVMNEYINVIKDVDFTVNDNEIFGIAGESGCGKSTLIKIMYDLLDYPLELSSGTVELHHHSPEEADVVLSSGQIKEARWRLISYVPQGAMHVLNPVRRIDTQFFDAIKKYNRKVPKKEIRKKIIAYLKELELPPEVMRAYPHQLSGGMKQRIIIALATFLNPAIVLADEPTTALDVVVQRGILTMLSRVQQKNKNSMVIVSHDMGVHYQITNRMGIMYAGEMIEVGPTDDLFNHPHHPYTKMLINALPHIGDVSQKEGIPGSPPSLKTPPPGCRFAPRCKQAMEICKTIPPRKYVINSEHQANCHLLEGMFPSISNTFGDVKNG